jgi:hypothetical protein
MKFSVFIHATNLLVDKFGVDNKDHCQQILNQIEQYMLESEIYKDADNIFLEIQGHQEKVIKFNVPNSTINYNGRHAHDWEFPTLNKIREYSSNNPSNSVLYIHTQGVSYQTTKLIEDRREYLLYWNVTNYKKCLEFLKTNDTCGAMLIGDPVKHYSQNFWWANCNHINTLPDPSTMTPVFDLRHNAEFWVCSRNEGKYSTINNLYNHYVGADDFSKEKYR